MNILIKINEIRVDLPPPEFITFIPGAHTIVNDHVFIMN